MHVVLLVTLPSVMSQWIFNSSGHLMENMCYEITGWGLARGATCLSLNLNMEQFNHFPPTLSSALLSFLLNIFGAKWRFCRCCWGQIDYDCVWNHLLIHYLIDTLREFYVEDYIVCQTGKKIKKILDIIQAISKISQSVTFSLCSMSVQYMMRTLHFTMHCGII